jgi:hypothetical protein
MPPKLAVTLAIICILILAIAIAIFISRRILGLPPARPPSPLCPPEAEAAALDVLYPRMTGLRPSYYHPTQAEIDRFKDEIANLREWANSLPDRCARAAYVHWLDYYDHEAFEAEAEVRTRKQERGSEEYRKRVDAERNREREWRADNPDFPTPPRSR